MTDVQTAPAPEAAKRKRQFNLGFDKYSGLYVWALLVIVFSLWIPDLFLQWDNAKTILSFQAISTIVALGLIIPVAAGAFDLTIAGAMTVAACFTSWALLNHKGVVFACGGALLIGVCVGLANALVVVKFKVDSFIGTLGMSSILAAVAYMITGGGQLVLPEAGYAPFLDFARQQWFGISASVYYAFGLAVVIWWMLEYTPGGRYLYAVGGNPVAARLAGVKVGRIIMLSFIASAVVASFAGILLLSTTANGAPDIGANYLLPAFSAVFLGATQIRPGRVNVIGTLVAIGLLATGVTGLQLAGAPSYVTQLFNGVALIVAMALAARTARRRS
jgi:ribose transport system permease protein